MWTHGPEALKCPEKGSWVALLRVTDEGVVTHLGYVNPKELEEFGAMTEHLDRTLGCWNGERFVREESA